MTVLAVTVNNILYTCLYKMFNWHFCLGARHDALLSWKEKLFVFSWFEMCVLIDSKNSSLLAVGSYYEKVLFNFQ